MVEPGERLHNHSSRMEGTSKGPVTEAVLGRSLAHPHVLPTFDYAISTEVGLGRQGQGGHCAGLHAMEHFSVRSYGL